jgi:hypothetical protein
VGGKGLSALGRIAILAAAFIGVAPTVLAEDFSRGSRAEELFRQGKALLGERNYARACPLLAESFELDPGTGTLLALAICHEGEGKLASASVEYQATATRAKSEGRADRERVARERALALESRVSTLAITPPPEARNTPDFVIRRSGVVVERDLWDKPVALDGGEYVIDVSAPGKKPFRAHVTLAPSAERRSMTIPPLESVVSPQGLVATTPPAVAPPTQSDSRANEKSDRRADRTPNAGGLSTLQMVGIGSMAAGAVGLGVGTFYAVRAMNKNEDSNQNGCVGDTCEGQGKEDRLAARSAGNTATVCFAVGATLGVGGVVMFVLGGTSDDSTATNALPVNSRVSLESRGVTLSLDGRF